MKQVGLELKARLLYRDSNFVVHAGIKADLERALKIIEAQRYCLVWFVGPARSGKSHFAVYLQCLLSSDNRQVLVISGNELCQQLERGISPLADVVIVDQAQQFFDTIHYGQSGSFVSYLEDCKNFGSKLVLLSDGHVDQYAFDEHILSRVLPGVGYHINPPRREDVPQLLASMAKQRGLLLSARKIESISRRIGSDLASIERYLDGLAERALVRDQSEPEIALRVA